LRVLQEREVVRLGSRRSIPIDVRVIAATNVRLQDAVAAGHFRQDLYYRLQVVQLAIPRLRERPADILPLAYHFLHEYRQRLGYGAPRIDAEGERKLREHDWPGNIRELENAIHHALLICQEDSLRAEHFHLSHVERRPAYAAHGGIDCSNDPLQALEQALQNLFNQSQAGLFEKIEDTVFRTAFEFCERNQVQAARLLDISRNVLRARLIRNGQISALK